MSRRNLTTGAAFFALLFLAAILMTISGGSPGNPGGAPNYRSSMTAAVYDDGGALPRRTYDYNALPAPPTSNPRTILAKRI